ncbi:hypothetical protein ACFL1S_07095 [Pseudomonadota bacterium]
MTVVDVIETLILIGTDVESHGRWDSKDLHSLKNIISINEAFGDWNILAKILKTNELTALIKGLTIAERELSWTGGSASGGWRLYKALVERRTGATWTAPESFNDPIVHEVTEWVLTNRSNEYLPFGGHLPLNVKSIRQYVE